MLVVPFLSYVSTYRSISCCSRTLEAFFFKKENLNNWKGDRRPVLLDNASSTWSGQILFPSTHGSNRFIDKFVRLIKRPSINLSALIKFIGQAQHRACHQRTPAKTLEKSFPAASIVFSRAASDKRQSESLTGRPLHAATSVRHEAEGTRPFYVGGAVH